MAAGWAALADRGHRGPVVVLACDLPRLEVPIVRLLASWPGSSSVVPVVDGRRQPLCARWSAEHLDTSASLVATGARSLRALTDLPGVVLLEESEWSKTGPADWFRDVDTPEDLGHLGGSY